MCMFFSFFKATNIFVAMATQVKILNEIWFKEHCQSVKQLDPDQDQQNV